MCTLWSTGSCTELIHDFVAKESHNLKLSSSQDLYLSMFAQCILKPPWLALVLFWGLLLWKTVIFSLLILFHLCIAGNCCVQKLLHFQNCSSPQNTLWQALSFVLLLMPSFHEIPMTTFYYYTVNFSSI